MENIDLKFEILNSKHCEELTLLYGEIFGKKVGPEYFQIKYGLNFQSQKQYSVIGIIDGEIVGFFGAYPQTYLIDGEEHKIMNTCDYFLKSQYRGKKVFEEIYQYFLNVCKESEVRYLYAFQSIQTFKFCQKQGWTEYPDLRRYQIKVFPRRIKSGIERVLGSAWSKKRLGKHLKPFLKELTINDLKSDENGRMILTDSFLPMKAFNQRYFVEMDGCLMWIKYDYRLTVGWVKLSPSVEIEKLLLSLKSIARKSGIHELVFHFVSGDKEMMKFSKYLKDFPSFKVSYLQLVDDAPPFEKFKFNYIESDLF